MSGGRSGAGRKRPSQKGGSEDPPAPAEHAAFDRWLQGHLRRMFDDVAREPIPDSLLELIASKKRQG